MTSQLAQYKALCEETLRPLVKQQEAAVDLIAAQRGACAQTLDQLRYLQAHSGARGGGSPREPCSLLYDVGAGCAVEALVDDASTVFINVGLGCYPQMPVAEALACMAAKDAMLRKEEDSKRTALEAIMADLIVAEATIRSLSSGSIE